MSTSVHSYTSKFPVFSFLYYEGIYRGVYVSFIWFIYHFIPKNIKKKKIWLLTGFSDKRLPKSPR